MFRPQKVYVKTENPTLLDFDLFTDIKPLKNMTPPILNNEAQSMANAVGTTFQIEPFLQSRKVSKNLYSKIKHVMTYLATSVDPSLLRFGSNGGMYHHDSLLPNVDLIAVMENLVSKKSKTLVNGEYNVLMHLTKAPHSILSLINPQKLKLCNVQIRYSTEGPPMANTALQPPKTVTLPPGPAPTASNQVVVRTAHPSLFKPYSKPQKNTVINKIPTKPVTQKPISSSVQKRFNAKSAPAWYKIL